MRFKNINFFANMLLNKTPYAKADIKGSSGNPGLMGTVYFYPAHRGTLVAAELYGLPREAPGTGNTPPVGPFGFHIHEGGSCEEGSPSDTFPKTGGHFNPTQMPHPFHAGDMPVLFSNNGYAFLVFYTDRFTPEQIIGRTVVIHESPDDFRSQPAGNAGKKIGCGVIVKLYTA